MDQNLVLPTVYRLPLQTSLPEIRLRPGEIFVRTGAPMNGCVSVKSGRLKRWRAYRSGEFLHGVAGSGDCLGLREAMGRGDSVRLHRETLQAVDETVIVIVPLSDVTAWVSSAPGSLLTVVSGAFADIWVEKFLSRPMGLLPVRARVAAALWLLSIRHGRFGAAGLCALDLDLTREEIAQLAGTVYESVIRTLTSLKRQGVVDLNGRVIEILDNDQLARIGQIVTGGQNDENSFFQNYPSTDNSAS